MAVKSTWILWHICPHGMFQCWGGGAKFHQKNMVCYPFFNYEFFYWHIPAELSVGCDQSLMAASGAIAASEVIAQTNKHILFDFRDSQNFTQKDIDMWWESRKGNLKKKKYNFFSSLFVPFFWILFCLVFASFVTFSASIPST